MATNNFWRDFLSETPDLLWQTMRPMGQTQPFYDWWRSQQGRVMGNYMGNYGRSLMSGQATEWNPLDYLSNYPFMQEWWNLNPSQRGERTVPGVKWNIPMF